jgi:hypothetical protein
MSKRGCYKIKGGDILYKQSGVSVAEQRDAVLSLLRREEEPSVMAERLRVAEQTLYRWRDEFLSEKALVGVVVGIPNDYPFDWKKPLTEYARKHPRIMKLPTINLCGGTRKQAEILAMFDAGDMQYENTRYFRFHRDRRGKTPEIIKNKIERFRDLYEQIKRGKYFGPPIITDDGCRLDGGHRSSIYKHLGYREIECNVARYEDMYDDEHALKIRETVKQYRSKFGKKLSWMSRRACVVREQTIIDAASKVSSGNSGVDMIAQYLRENKLLFAIHLGGLLKSEREKVGDA